MNLETLATRCFPNGDFTIGYSAPKSKRDGKVGLDDEHYENELRRQDESVRWQLEDTLSERWKNNHYQPKAREIKPRARKGLKGIKGEARRKIRSGCYLLQQRYGKDRLGFLTLTLPNADWLVAIWAQNFDEITRQFVQEMRRELRRKNAPDNLVGAIEIQEKRFAQYGDIAPHLHIAYVAKTKPRKGSFYIQAAKFRKIWKRILSGIAKKYCDNFEELSKEIEWNAAINCSVIKRNVEAYMSKYLSKGHKNLEEIVETGRESEIPRAWYTITRQLLRAIMACIITLPPDLIELIISCIDAKDAFIRSHGLIAWMQKLEIPINADVTLTGYIGRLDRERLEEKIVQANP